MPTWNYYCPHCNTALDITERQEKTRAIECWRCRGPIVILGSKETTYRPDYSRAIPKMISKRYTKL
jgi:DNA-directed RNA polymerase subunit RPC12/RpoP